MICFASSWRRQDHRVIGLRLVPCPHAEQVGIGVVDQVGLDRILRDLVHLVLDLAEMREDLALNAPTPRNRDRGVKVIVIKIINEDEDEDEENDEGDDGCRQVMVVRPQLQPVRAVNCCPRLHKKKF